jgi:hypothetical protein
MQRELEMLRNKVEKFKEKQAAAKYEQKSLKEAMKENQTKLK